MKTMEIGDQTYFKAVPTECSEIILKLLYSEDIFVTGDIWTDITTKSLDIHKDFSLLFSQHSPFRSVVSSMFTKLCFDSVYQDSGLLFSDETIVISPTSEVELNSALVSQVFDIFGSSIKFIEIGEICINHDDDANNKFALKLVAFTLKYCRNVEELSFVYYNSNNTKCVADGIILDGYAPQLKSLHWIGDYRIANLSACSSIKRIDYVATYQSLIELLPPVGGTLESLQIDSLSDRFEPEVYYEKVLDVIQENCKHLHTLILCDSSVFVTYAGEERYASLLCSFGNQLIEANIEGLSKDKLLDVTEKCTKLELAPFQTSYSKFDDAMRINIIGSCLRSLTLGERFCFAKQWSNALAKSTNLRQLCLEGTSVLCLLPKLPFLEALVLRGKSVSLHDISCIASKASNLKTFELAVFSAIESGEIFKPLVNSNKCLEKVNITEYWGRQLLVKERPPTDYVLKVLRQLLITFSNCKVLRLDLLRTEGQVIVVQDVADICAVLPCREIAVVIQIGDEFKHEQTGKSRLALKCR